MSEEEKNNTLGTAEEKNELQSFATNVVSMTSSRRDNMSSYHENMKSAIGSNNIDTKAFINSYINLTQNNSLGSDHDGLVTVSLPFLFMLILSFSDFLFLI